MSGQPKVADSTVADVPNATAPTTNRPPVVRRSPWPMIAVVIGFAPLDGVQDLYGVQKEFYRAGSPVKGVAHANVRTRCRTTPSRPAKGPHRGRDPRRGADPARPRRPRRALRPRHRRTGRRRPERRLHLLSGQGRRDQGARRAAARRGRPRRLRRPGTALARTGGSPGGGTE